MGNELQVMRLNIAICDDEKAIREQINELIEKEKAGICPDLYETGDALLAAGRKFDIVFLDIQMEGTDGIETAKKLRERDEDTILIFITGIREYVFEAFDVAAFHYLLKPIEEDKFHEVFQRAGRELEKRKSKRRETVFIKTRNRSFSLERDSILYIESRGKKVEIHITVRRIYGLFLQGRSPHAIAKLLMAEGIPSSGGKEVWSSSTVKSILTNEKYKGDALLQKVYTVDFLSKKKKVNEGEVPQYYVENNHQAIISPSVFEEAQHQMTARHSGKNRASCTGVFSSRIKCGDCGGWYGSKVWHSNSKYRRTIWQCNHKFDGGEKCGTPHLDEDTIQALFLKAANAIFAEKDGVREDYDSIKDTVFGTSELEAERLRLQEEMNVVAERFNGAKARLKEVGSAITERQAKREEIGRFVSCLEQMDGPLTKFKEDDWYSLVDYATVYGKDDIRFTFKNGMEIKA